MDVIWTGITSSSLLSDKGQAIYQRLADAAKSHDWPTMFALLDNDAELVNATRPDGISLYAPLHQMAYGGASLDDIKRLIKLGAWRTLQNARGERAIDIAEIRGHQHLLPLLRPRIKHQVPTGILLRIQSHLHDVIHGRVRDLIEQHQLRLPELEPLLELKEPKMWFAVPGMYGGFSYWIDADGASAKLVAESWCRVAGGSGQRHEITSAGSELVAEGFV